MAASEPLSASLYIDNKQTGHIRGDVQELILEFNFNIAMHVADCLSETGYDKIQGTQSAILCPLIYEALRSSDPPLHTEYYIVDAQPLSASDKASIIKYATLISKVPKWKEYCEYILKTDLNIYATKLNGRSGQSSIIDKLSAEIKKNLGYENKYLKYKNKYINLKNKLNI